MNKLPPQGKARVIARGNLIAMVLAAVLVQRYFLLATPTFDICLRVRGRTTH